MAKQISESTAAPTQDAIARRAYEIWESEGRPDGRAADHWFRAVQQLNTRRSEPAEESEETSSRMKPSKPAASRRNGGRASESRLQAARP
jgi:hypothetical protein